MRIINTGQIIPNGLSIFRTGELIGGYETGVVVLVFPLFAWVGDYFDLSTMETYHNIVQVKKVRIKFKLCKNMIQFGNIPQNYYVR